MPFENNIPYTTLKTILIIFQFLFMQYRFQTTKQDLEILKIQNPLYHSLL